MQAVMYVKQVAVSQNDTIQLLRIANRTPPTGPSSSFISNNLE